MDQYSNKELFLGIRNRNDEIMTYIIIRYRPAVIAMIRRMGGSSDIAKDIFHDGLLYLIEKIINNEFPLTGKFQNVLHMVCSNKFKDRLRRSGAADNYYSEQIHKNEYEDFSDEINREVYLKAMHEAIGNLKELCRDILKLYLMGNSLKTIADRLSFNYVHVRKQFSSCRDQLAVTAREKLGKYEDY